MARPRRWMLALASGCTLLQLNGCADIAAESLVRIAANMVFTPINSTITSLLSGLTT